MGVLKVFLGLCLIGLLDTFLLGGTTYDAVACDDVGVTRMGLHQGKTEAWLLYFFIAHVYDNVLNPWHWTEEMRTASLTSGGFGLAPGLTVADVGAGTGFTTIGVLEQKVRPEDVTMLDQSPQQLSKARAKPELQNLNAILEGDAENLPANWTGNFDRYVSAGSIEYWPHPQLAIDEAARIIKPGGKAMIIGPVRATNPVSRFFADMWYLFPEEREYMAWYKAAGFTNVTIARVTPSWYNGDRSHGLIMGCAVVGTKPEGWTPPVRKIASKPEAQTPAENKIFSLVMALPRFALGSAGGAYYALLPMCIFAKNVYFGGSWLAFLASVFLPLLALAYSTIFPSSFTPLGEGSELEGGIRKLYDDSSSTWESVWGEHMHTGYYDLFDDDTKFSHEDHLKAQDRMMVQLLEKWDHLLRAARSAEEEGRPLRILDVGCGVGGSSRFLSVEVPKRAADAGITIAVEVKGITLSPYQAARAERLSAPFNSESASLSFQVTNALNTEMDASTFDLVWSLESGEHIPNKVGWLREMARLLRPGGTMVVATWCCRDEADGALTDSDKLLLTRICKNYSLPDFVPLEAYRKVSLAAGLDDFDATAEDWSDAIEPFWPAVISMAFRPLTILRVLIGFNWTIVKGAVTAFMMKTGFEEEVLVFGAFAVSKAGGQRRSARSRRASGSRTADFM